MFGAREILVPAIKLLSIEGVEQSRSFKPVTYVHVLCRDHQIIFAEGLPCESLYLGNQAQHALDPAACHELEAILPGAFSQAMAAARPIIEAKGKVNQLILRHAKNGLEFLEPAES